MNSTQFKNKKRCLHYKTYCILLRVAIFKTILVTNNSWTHEMTMNEKFPVSGLDTGDGAPTHRKWKKQEKRPVSK